MDLMRSQLKFANQIQKRKSAKTSSSESNVTISREIADALNIGGTDQNGFLDPSVASGITQPLDSMSLFCPTTALVTSKNVAAEFNDNRDEMYTRATSYMSKIENPLWDKASSLRTDKIALTEERTTNSSTTNNMTTSDQDSSNRTGVSIHPVKARLESLWLRRKADISYREGDTDSAIAHLQEAIDQHLGTKDYTSANLSQPTLPSDPMVLLDTIHTNFLLYDETVHRKASRLQRFIHRKYLRRVRLATILQTVFRGFLHRKMFWRRNEVRRQCARLLQRRFRSHLKKMNALATKLKEWYRIRKLMKQFQQRLLIYRAARTIQRLYRGYKGRLAADKARQRLLSIFMVQRNSRGYTIRRDKTFGIVLFHKLFFHAAKQIQHFVRRKQAIRRAQVKLLLELARENIRDRKEKLVVHETLRISKLRNRFYIKTIAGKLHVSHVDRMLRARASMSKDMKHNKSKSLQESEEHYYATKVMDVLESFDEDGTGYVSVSRLEMILNRICVPTNPAKLNELIGLLDKEGNGYINFNDLLDWYQSEDADDFVDPTSLSDNAMKGWLLMKRAVRRILKGPLKQAEKHYINEEIARLSRQTINEFRIKHPPKYQCCQCLKPFVLFTDYYVHFEESSGNCGVLNSKGLFFPAYWKQIDWLRQRQCEREIIRVNDEYPYVQSRIARCLFASIVENRDSSVKAFVEKQEKRARTVYDEKFAVSKPAVSSMTAKIIEYVQDLLSPIDDTNISIPVADCLMAHLQLPIARPWIIGEKCTFIQIKGWITSILGKDKVVDDSASYSDQAVGVESGDLMKNFIGGDPNKLKTLYDSKLRVIMDKFAVPPIFESGKIGKLCRRMAGAYVHTLRMMLVEIEASLISLAEFRKLRPNRITISDKDLLDVDLVSCTKFHYQQAWAKLTTQYSAVQKRYLDLYAAQIPVRRCLPNWIKKYEPVNPICEITLDELFEFMITETHLRSRASLEYKLQGTVGKAVQSAISHRLHAIRKKLSENFPGEKLHKYPCTNVSRVDGEFLFEILTSHSVDVDDTIQVVDCDLLGDALCARLDENILQSWRGGEVDSHAFQLWLESRAFKPCVRKTLYLREVAFILYNAGINAANPARSQAGPAKRLMCINDRKAARLRLLLTNELANVECDEVDALLESNNLHLAPTSSPLNDSVDSKLLPTFTGAPHIPPYRCRSAGENWDKLQTLRTQEIRSENHVIYEKIENRAHFTLQMSLFNWTGRRNLRTERILVDVADSMYTAFQTIVSDEQRQQYSLIHQEASSAPTTSLLPLPTDYGVSRYSDISLHVLVALFDIESCGYLKHNQIIFLFRTLGIRASDEFLFTVFPELQLLEQRVIGNDIVVQFLTRELYRRWNSYFCKLKRILFGRCMRTRSLMRTAWLKMISTERELARKQVEQSLRFNRDAELVSVKKVSDTNHFPLMVNAQLLAMRQIVMYLDSSHGKIKLYQFRSLVKRYRRTLLLNSCSYLALLRYAFAVHSESIEGCLITELPYIVQFLVDRMKFHPTSDLYPTMASVYSSIKGRKDIHWCSEKEVLGMLEPCFIIKTMKALQNNNNNQRRIVTKLWLNRDSRLKMMSNARQQAVLISMRFQDIAVQETNYRCSILGLHRAIEFMGGTGLIKWAAGRISSLLSKRRKQKLNNSSITSHITATSNEISLNTISAEDGSSKPDKADQAKGKQLLLTDSRAVRVTECRKVVTNDLDWDFMPREAAVLFLMSQGYSISELHDTALEHLVTVNQRDRGSLDNSMISVKHVRDCARREIFSKFSLARKIASSAKAPFAGFAFDMEYRQVASVLQMDSKLVDKYGAEFFKELVTGTSHCTK